MCIFIASVGIIANIFENCMFHRGCKLNGKCMFYGKCISIYRKRTYFSKCVDYGKCIYCMWSMTSPYIMVRINIVASAHYIVGVYVIASVCID